MGFKKATKEQSKLRLAMFGPTGAGKTYTSLAIGSGMAEAIGGKVALIDSEKGSAAKYSDFFDFDTLELIDRVQRTPNSPPIFDKSIEGYVDAMREAAKSGYDVLIIDSGSHAWQELLEDIDRLAATKYKGNSFRAWSEGTPKQKYFVNAILGYPGHIIMTMRSKMEYSVEKDNEGRTKVNKLGLSPEQGKAIEYEFDQLMEITTEHFATVTKDRTSKFQDHIIDRPGKDFGRQMIEWLNEGKAPSKQYSIPERMNSGVPNTDNQRRNTNQAPSSAQTYNYQLHPRFRPGMDVSEFNHPFWTEFKADKEGFKAKYGLGSTKTQDGKYQIITLSSKPRPEAEFIANLYKNAPPIIEDPEPEFEDITPDEEFPAEDIPEEAPVQQKKASGSKLPEAPGANAPQADPKNTKGQVEPSVITPEIYYRDGSNELMELMREAKYTDLQKFEILKVKRIAAFDNAEANKIPNKMRDRLVKDIDAEIKKLGFEPEDLF